MFIVRTKSSGFEKEWNGYVYVLDPETMRPKRFKTNSEALAYVMERTESSEVLNKLEVIDEDSDLISRIAVNEDGLSFSK